VTATPPDEQATRRGGGRRGTGRRPGGATVRETSAGGLVVRGPDHQLEAALIGRTDRRGRLLWSLPKGHVEEGETLEQTAEREVEEETGIRGRVLAPLGEVEFFFAAEGRTIRKTVHHFLLRFVDGELSDADHEVTEVAWVPVDELVSRLAHPDERGIARIAVATLGGVDVGAGGAHPV
jgi:8-oxo-dGTP pyrophosphatase MutT (NUDIX family)